MIFPKLKTLLNLYSLCQNEKKKKKEHLNLKFMKTRWFLQHLVEQGLHQWGQKERLQSHVGHLALRCKLLSSWDLFSGHIYAAEHCWRIRVNPLYPWKNRPLEGGSGLSDGLMTYQLCWLKYKFSKECLESKFILMCSLKQCIILDIQHYCV